MSQAFDQYIDNLKKKEKSAAGTSAALSASQQNVPYYQTRSEANNLYNQAKTLKDSLFTIQDNDLLNAYQKAGVLGRYSDSLMGRYAIDPAGIAYQSPLFRGQGTVKQTEELMGIVRPLGGNNINQRLTAPQIRMNAVSNRLSGDMDYDTYKKLMDSQIGVGDADTQRLLMTYGGGTVEKGTARMAAAAAASATSMEALEDMLAKARTDTERAAINAEISKRQSRRIDKSGIGQYGLGNIDLYNRKPYTNEDGSISTVDSFSVNIDGQEVLLPSIIDGRRVTDEEAIAHYMKTGEHLGKFNTPEEADDYAQRLHIQQEELYAEPQDSMTAEARKNASGINNGRGIVTEEDKAADIYEALNDDQKAEMELRRQYGADITGYDYMFALQDEAVSLKKQMAVGRMTPEQQTAAEERLNDINAAIELFNTPIEEYVPDEVKAFQTWQEQGKDTDFLTRYQQDAAQEAQDWTDVTRGRYYGEDKEKQESSDKIEQLTDEYNALVSTVGGITDPQEYATTMQRMEEIETELDALNTVAEQKAGSEGEKLDAIRHANGIGTKGVAGVPDAVAKSTKSGIANFLGGVATTFVGTYVKPFEVLGETLYTLDQNLANTIMGKTERNRDVGEAITDTEKYGQSQRFIDEVQANKQELAEDAQRARLAVSDSPVLEVAQTLYINFVEQLPELAATVLTGMGSTTMDGIAKMRETMMGVINDASARAATNGAAAAGSVQTAIRNMITNQSFWATFAREFQDNIDKTKEAGAGSVLTAIKGTLESLIDAGLEVGPFGTSGWQGFGQGDDPTALERLYTWATGNDPGRVVQTAGNLLSSSAGEMVEEGTQGINSSAQDAIVRALTTGESTPVVSMTEGEDALINVPELAREGAIGFLGGLTMGGAMGAVNTAAQNAQTREQNREIGEQIINNNWGEALGGIAEDAAGISNDTTKALREGTADLSSKKIKQKVGQLYQQMMDKLDKASTNRIQIQMERSIENAMIRNDFPATSREQLKAAAKAVAKAYGLGPQSLNETEMEIMQRPEVQEVYEGLTGENAEFQDQFGPATLRKGREAQQAMNQARVMLMTRNMTQEEVIQRTKENLNENVAEEDRDALAAAIVKQENGQELSEAESKALDKYGLNMDAMGDEYGTETAYNYGRSGRSQEELERNLRSAGIDVTDEVRQQYQQGEKERIQAEQNRIQQIRELNQGGKNGQRNGVVRGASEREAQYYNVKQIDAGKLTTKQKAAIEALRTVAGKMNLNIALFESQTNEKGTHVGANGFYDESTDTVYLDIFAGYEKNEQAILRTAAHELTHVIQQWSPQEYANLRDYLLESYYGQGENTVAQLIQHQMDIARRSGRNMTEPQAMDELVADACEMMLGDAEGAARMAQKNPSLFEKIKNWISDFVQAIKAAMEGVDPQTREARLLAGMQERFEKARDLWYAGFNQAAENRGGGMNAEMAPETITSQENLSAAPAENAGAAVAQPAAEAPRRAENGQKRVTITKYEVNANRGIAYTNDQTPVSFHYEAVPVDSLITSNNQRFEANPDYPQELQPRDRTRTASREQVYGIARNLNPARLGESADVQNGAPIVGSDLVVESGNGRTMALRYAMQNMPGQAQQYTAWLRQNAARFGLDPDSIQEDSVLVRVRDSAMDRKAFGKAANESTTAAYSESEAAESDAEKLTPAMMQIFEPGENGELNAASNSAFANRYMEQVIPAAERGNYMQADGTISQRGWERIQNGIFQKAYGSAALTQMLSESTDEGSRNILKAMLRAAPRAVQTAEQIRQGNTWDIGLGDMLTNAAKRYLQLKRDGIKLDTYLNQTTMPGLETEDAGTQALMRAFEDLNRAPRRLGNVLQNVMDLLEEYGDPRQVNMLGESTAPDAAALISQAVARESQSNAEGIKQSARDSEYMQAVESGDTEEQQRLVDEAAEEAMQNSQIRDDDGRLLVVYHGTSEHFTVFDMSKGRANMDIQGSFFSPWDIDAGGYGENVGSYYLNITNPAPEGIAYRALNMFTGQNGAGVKAREYLIKQGYDGVNNSGEEYIAFYPEQIKSADAVTYDNQGNVIPLSERFNLENNDIRYSARDSEYLQDGQKINFEYMKPFAEQVDDFMDTDKRKALFEKDGLLIGTTPKVLQDIGLIKTIVAIDQKHAGYSLLGNYGGNEHYGRDHMISPEEFKKLPEKLANPIAVIADSSTHDLIIFIDMQNVDGKQVIMPYRLESGMKFNGKTRDVQRVKTVYGEEKAENLLRNAILNDSDEQIRLYYWDKKRAQQVAGLGVHEHANSLPDGLIHKITDPGSTVKMEIKDQTDTMQFTRWFGNSVMTENGKAQGKPRVFYHGTNSGGFTVFDKNMIGKAREGDVGFFGRGFYFAYSRGEAETYGRDVIEAYLKINKPFNFQKELDTYAGERTNDYNASRAVFVTNLVDKLPELATRHRVEIYPNNGGQPIEMSLKEFAAEFKRAVNEVEYRVDDLGNGEWVVLADPERYSYTRPDGTEDNWIDYNYQQKFYSEKDAENKLTRAFYYLENTLGKIRIPASASIVQEVDFGEAVQKRGYDGIIQSETGDEAVVFEPTQIKSTDNTGMFDPDNPDIRYSARDTAYQTNRQILAGALTTIAANESERQMLEQYQNVAGQLDMNERRISQINEELRNLRLEEPGSDRERALLAERKQLEQEITAADKRLYTMERLAPMRRIASQQRAKAENDLQRAREHMQRYREGIVQRERIASIERTSRRLAKWLTAPAGKSGNYVPEALRGPLGEFLLTIDKMSKQRREGGPMTQEDKKFAYQLGQISRMLQSIDDGQTGTTEEQISGLYLDMPKQFTQNLAELVNRVEQRMQQAGARPGGNMLDQMSNEELETLDQSMIAISSSITHINDFMSDSFTKGVRETAAETIRDLDAMKPQGKQGKVRKFLTDFITWDNSMPIFAFERLGKTGRAVFDSMREGQGKLAFNAEKIKEESEKIYTAKEGNDWSREIKEFDFGDGNKIRIPVANLMSLYCLNQREQGIGHLYGEGIRVADFEEGKGARKATVHDKGHVISEAQVQKMLEALTPRQIEVARKLQHLMSTLGAEWGNYVSMRRFGFRQFTEKNYFPIKSDSDLLPARTDNGTGNELYKLLNMSAAKPLVQKANNRLMLENIFEVFGGHMADMAQYNALALPVLDAVKWFNFKESVQEEGESAKYTSGVRDSIRNAYGQSAIKYVTEFLKDINGGGMTGDTNTDLMKKMLGKYNRVAVAANLRVALLQPLAIIRAGVELPGTSLASGTIKAIPNLKKEVAEMQAHSGIALWKDLGYREMNIGRSLKQQIMHMDTLTDKISDKSMALAGLMDNVTWGAMWKASKEFVNRTQPTLTRGSEEYFQAVTKKFEDVVYKTQVVDSMLTKSQLMRSQNNFNKLISSFMSEPTTTFNQLMAVWDKFRVAMKNGSNFSQAFQKHGKALGRTAFYFLLAAAVNTAIEQLMTAYRDDDDYENFQEKYMDGFWETMIDNANPLTLLPGMKQIWEAGGKRLLGMDTFDDQNVLTEGINTVVDGIEKIAQGKGTVWGRAYTLAKGLSMTSGLPLHPLMREFQAIWNATAAQIQPDWRLETSPTSKTIGYDILYKALQEKDEERVKYILDRLSYNGASDDAITSNLTNRIKADYASGQISAAEAESRLVDMVGKKANDAYFNVQQWKDKVEDDGEYSRFDKLEAAILSNGSTAEAEKELLDHGYTQKQVDAKKKTLITEAAKDGKITDAQATQMFARYTDLDKDEAYWRLQGAHYEKQDDDDSYQKYGKLEDAILTGKGYEAAKAELTSHGVKEADVTSKVRSIVTEQVVTQGMTDAKAMYLLKKYGGMDDNEAWIRTQELAYQKATGNSTSSDIAMVNLAIEKHASPKAAIDGLLAHGKEKSSIASSITSKYKQQYLDLVKTNVSQAATLKGQLISIFEYLGYDGKKKISDWENPKKKTK